MCLALKLKPYTECNVLNVQVGAGAAGGAGGAGPRRRQMVYSCTFRRRSCPSCHPTYQPLLYLWILRLLQDFCFGKELSTEHKYTVYVQKYV